jgi:hypothetical protein
MNTYGMKRVVAKGYTLCCLAGLAEIKEEIKRSDIKGAIKH